ncbi:addiction module toxin RelE [Rahnella victoriana]|uniref:type II toxin-antitoxin system RelE/ParE family toxin n=1 Tax=Rahnella victoriana TaxID=1510570 RepID=UPI000BB1D5B0|nr:type II toxin-antitoxin system RelE/ParE family toxin [Rahnella victoriana]PBI81056.1 addiction module toxin RelE [Rahnella victoriana]
MSEGLSGQRIDTFESHRFTKAFGRLPLSQQIIVEDEIERIQDDPQLGELKKGDLSYLRVHKFPLEKQQALLGYCWREEKIELYLLSLDSHENFYQDHKNHRKGDLKMMK